MKFWKILYVLLVCIILATPLMLFPFSKNTSSDNRALSAFPNLMQDEQWNIEYTAEMDVWLSEHFPLRSELISFNNYWKSAVFSTSDEQQVIIGKEDWLYFSDTLPDYLGENLLSDTALQRIHTTLSLINESVAATGGKFVFAIAPNKNTVYPEHMPERYKKSMVESNLKRLTALLQEASYFADLLGALQQEDTQMYHKRDTHWNNLGAVVGYRALMNTVGETKTPFDEISYIWENTHRGDLDTMLFPTLNSLDTQAILNMDWQYTITSNYHTEEDMLITTENADGEGSLLFFRDSFGNALLPLLANTYKETTLSRVTPYDLRNSQAYDTIMLEIVERNLKNLLSSAPIMMAPSRDNVTKTEVISSQIFTLQEHGMLHIYGSTQEEYAHIFLQLTNGNDTKIVEAFPIYEMDLVNDASAQSPFGFSAYVSPEYENYKISVLG